LCWNPFPFQDHLVLDNSILLDRYMKWHNENKPKILVAEIPVEAEFESLAAEAELLYPKLAGRFQLLRLPAAYHQLMTNAFRQAWKYGKRVPTAEELTEILKQIYSKYPLP
jgi:hypothetical protein